MYDQWDICVGYMSANQSARSDGADKPQINKRVHIYKHTHTVHMYVSVERFL